MGLRCLQPTTNGGTSRPFQLPGRCTKSLSCRAWNLTDVNLNLTYDILPSLSYTLKTFLRNRNTNRGIYRSSLHSAGDEGIGGIGVLANDVFKQVLIENIVNYSPQLNEVHDLDFTAVQAFDEQKSEYTQTDKAGFTNNALGYNGDATTLLANTRNVSQRRLLS